MGVAMGLTAMALVYLIEERLFGLAGREGNHGEDVKEHASLGRFRLACEGTPDLLFADNETNTARLFGAPNATPWVKDAFHDHVVHGRPLPPELRRVRQRHDPPAARRRGGRDAARRSAPHSTARWRHASARP
jgi:hypothetical protein